MKAFLISLLGSLISLAAYADRHVNPDYECITTGVITPTAVERSKKATKITFHAVYRPHFWIMVDSTAYIADAKTDTRYFPVSTEGLVFGEEFWMPDSGEADFSVIFPPMPEEVNAIDFIDGTWRIYGLRLDGKKAPKASEVDPDEWAKEHQRAYPGEPSQFFNTADTKISGRIRGYDPRLGFDNILLYYQNPFTGKRDPIALPVMADGSFYGSIPMASPGYFSISFSSYAWLSYYAEPGRTLDILLDWDDVLKASLDRIMERDSHMPNTRFGGDIGRINCELAAAPSAPATAVYQMAHDSVPSVALKVILADNERYKTEIDNYKVSSDIHSVTKKVMDADVNTDLIFNLLEYAMYRDDMSRYDTVAPSLKEPLDIGFFKPLKEAFAVDNQWLFAGKGMDMLPNRIAFCCIPDLLGAKCLQRFTYTDSGILYLKEHGAKLTPEEEETAAWLTGRLGTTEYLEVNEFINVVNRLNIAEEIAKRNGMEGLFEEFVKKGNEKNMTAEGEFDFEAYNALRRAEAVAKWAGLDRIPLLWQSAYSASLCSYGKTNTSAPREETFSTVNRAIENNIISHPYFVKVINGFFEDAYAFKPYDIPDDDRGRVLREIVAPYAGKFILLDFWGTSCGPCRAAIESSSELRQRNLDHPDFKMIFITGESDSPEGAYNKYVAENLVGEATHRLSDSDLNRLRGLFKISGIPHYVLIGRDGKILIEHFHFHSLSDALSEHGVTLK